ncbi:MAG: histidine--tRNA ligase [Candidatus Levybacteria bacterium]|nr:histidine--tRNA ligase [Candidatus Levybacteria bacterium]
MIRQLADVFESYGFEPLETPALEYEEVLLGKYGEEGDKIMYRFEDLGGRKVALRYDQTVPLARVVAQYGSTGSPQLPFPFKRYQIQPVWRAENTQKGRFREFLQCDADAVGTKSVLSDAEVIAVAAKALEKLGFKNFRILINDRSIFKNIPPIAIRAIDKLKKIGREKVLEEMVQKGIKNEQATYILQSIEQAKPTERLKQIFSSLEKFGVEPLKYEFSPTLARGLDYYTSTIFEIEIDGYTAGSVCGGGRYDNLIGMFSGKDTPAVGFAFGFDRLMEAMEELNLFPNNLTSTKILVTIFSKELKEKSIEVSSELRSNGINTELYPDEEVKLDKQLKYADQKNIPYAVIIGPVEAKNNTATLKNLKTGDQKTISKEELLKIFSFA